MAALVAPQELALRGTVVAHFNQDNAANMMTAPPEERDYEYVLDCKTTSSKEHVILAISDCTIQARNRTTLGCERQFNAHASTITEVVVSETEPWSVVTSSNDKTIKMWDLRQSQPTPVHTIRAGNEVWSCSIGCGDTLVVAGVEDCAVFYDLRNGRRLGQYGESHMDNVTRVRFHPHRRSEVITASDDGIVCLFDCTIADEDEAIISIINVESSVSQFCIFGPDYHNIACMTGSETLDVWNITTAQRLAHFPQIRDQCNALKMPTDYLIDCQYDSTKDHLYLATGDHQGRLNLFELNGTNGVVPRASLQGGHKSAIRCINWDNDMLLTGGEDARLCKWASGPAPPSHAPPLIALVAAVANAVRNTTSTAIIVGAKASVSGAPMNTHSNDCPDCDFRLVKVPPVQYTTGGSEAVRDVFLFSPQYPRYVGNARGSVYTVDNLEQGLFNWTESIPIAQIPQIRETYGYFEGVHGIINEHQLAFGQSTCGAKLVSRPITQGGDAYFDITELTRIALERTKTARDAIALMGKLAENYGYYGSYWDDSDPYGCSGEALTVTDPKEGWIFHILPDDTGKSAVWAAQRVPDTDVAVVANQFVIHQVNLTDAENFMGSSNMFDVAERNGFWDGVLEFDFTVAFATQLDWQYSSTRRMWRVFNLADPTWNLSPVADPFAITYPFSVPVSGDPLTALALFQYLRDHYEETEFDLTSGIGAGPYGNPDRFAVQGDDAVGGHFEVAISGQGTYSFVTVLHPSNDIHALLWFGPYAPHATTYVPVYALSDKAPDVTSDGTLRRFDITTSYWLHSIIGNYVARWYKHAHPVVEMAQNLFEFTTFDAQEAIQSTAQEVLEKVGRTALVEFLTKTTESFANDAHASSMNLFTSIVTRFHDGYIISDFTQEILSVDAMSYPKWWLESAGFYGSDRPTNVGTRSPEETPSTSPASITSIRVGSKDSSDNTTNTSNGTPTGACPTAGSSGAWGALVLVIFTGMLVGSATLGFFYGKRHSARTSGYAYIQ